MGVRRKLAAAVLGGGMVVGLTLGVAAPANAWYLGGFSSYSDCAWSARGKAASGATITHGCAYRPYDGKWGYSYEYYRGYSG